MGGTLTSGPHFHFYVLTFIYSAEFEVASEWSRPGLAVSASINKWSAVSATSDHL